MATIVLCCNQIRGSVLTIILCDSVARIKFFVQFIRPISVTKFNVWIYESGSHDISICFVLKTQTCKYQMWFWLILNCLLPLWIKCIWIRFESRVCSLHYLWFFVQNNLFHNQWHQSNIWIICNQWFPFQSV